MSRPDGSSFTPESENKPLAGRKILVTGGATGTGLNVGLGLSRLGAEIIVGTRDQKKFDEAASKIGEGRAFPFIADLTKDTDIRKAIAGLYIGNKIPTDVVLSAAGGMEPFMREFMSGLVKVNRADGDKREVLAAFREHITGLVDDAMGFAKAVNVEGQIYLMNVLHDTLLPGARVIYFSSLPSTFFNDHEPPAFYRGVAQTKHAFEEWLKQQAPRFKERGIHVSIVSAHGIIGTNVVKISERYILPLLPERQQLRFKSAFVTDSDMLDATLIGLQSDVRDWTENPRMLYAIAPGKVVDRLEASDPIFDDFNVPV